MICFCCCCGASAPIRATLAQVPKDATLSNHYLDAATTGHTQPAEEEQKIHTDSASSLTLRQI